MKLLKQLMLGLLCLTVNLAPLGAWPQDEAGLIEETDPWPSNPPRLVRIANNLLTVKVHDASVEELIEEIARQSGLNIVWYGTISERITLDFQGLALDQALARILRRHSFALASAQGGEGEGTAARPRKLWIIPKGAEGSPPQAAAANESERDDVLQDESLAAIIHKFGVSVDFLRKFRAESVFRCDYKASKLVEPNRDEARAPSGNSSARRGLYICVGAGSQGTVRWDTDGASVMRRAFVRDKTMPGAPRCDEKFPEPGHRF